MAPVLKVEQGQSMAEIEEAEERKAEEDEAAAEKEANQQKEDEQKAKENKPHAKPPPAPAAATDPSAKLTKLNKLIDKIAEYILRYVLNRVVFKTFKTFIFTEISLTTFFFFFFFFFFPLLLYRYHEDLEFHFHQSDVENSGSVKLSEWTSIMSDTLQLKLQWTKLRPHIAPDGDLESIDYRKFLGRYFIDFDGDHSFFNGVVGTIRDAIFLNGGDLHAAFEQFDEVSLAYC